ncbi:MAG: DNA repair protein RecN [Myxococcales bacterium]|nr:DNA repair protein RecN [Polyangiaceae bacterium]MDW8249092.1 DNA repair protein RecN [Myxococcales bacterium]
MLSTLRVRNFVLIDQLELELGPGLNVLTGETGAGKSILVDAIGLLLGGRASPDVIRHGADDAEVEALFTLGPDDAAARHLQAVGIPFQDELVIRRVVTQNGRSRAYLNGRLCTVAELASFGPLLMDIASQHESVSLTDPGTHLGYLDDFASLGAERDAVAARFDELRALAQQCQREAELVRSRAQREAYLSFQLATLDEVDPKPGEEEELQAERNRLRHADRIQNAIGRSVLRLTDDEGAIVDELGRIVSDLRSASAYEPALEAIATAIEAARNELIEASWQISRVAERVESDPARLSQIDERLYALEKLKRQYGPELSDVLQARDRLRAEYEALSSSEERLAELEAQREWLLDQVGEMAHALSAKRAAAAVKLSDSITRELAALGMGTARVVVEVAPLQVDDQQGLNFKGARLSRHGLDRVEFLIAPNKGVEPRPLRKVASGGELSRALLALKRVLADVAPAGAYLFDEVDTGVGGAVAEAIGRAMADVARHRQVICITHLAQIAAFGTTHFVVHKSVEDRMTRSTIVEVKGKPRVQELARMISGATVSDAARKAAIEMLRAAEPMASEILSARRSSLVSSVRQP